jgi:hypothetical protein
MAPRLDAARKRLQGLALAQGGEEVAAEKTNVVRRRTWDCRRKPDGASTTRDCGRASGRE